MKSNPEVAGCGPFVRPLPIGLQAALIGGLGAGSARGLYDHLG